MTTTATVLATLTALFGSWHFLVFQLENSGVSQVSETRFQGSDTIDDLERYENVDYGFSMAVPAGWTRIVAAESDIRGDDNLLESLEPGYVVGFESPRAGQDDRFADYILVEILPGADTGLFSTSSEHRQYIDVGNEHLAYDRLIIDSAEDDDIDVDLVIFQRGVQAFGYTLGFYAIGEPYNEALLFNAFEVLLRTYTQKEDPFVVL